MVPIPLPVIPFTWRVTLNWQDDTTGQIAANVLHIRNTGGDNDDDALTSVLDAAVDSQQWDPMADAWEMKFFEMLALDGVSTTAVHVPANPLVWQGHTGGQYDPAVSCVISLRTGVRGRANRGRIYLPSPAESQRGYGRLTDGSETTAAAAWANFLNDLNTGVGGSTWELVVASYDRKHNGLGAHATPVSGLTVEPVLATQRRRQSRLRI